MRDRPAPRPLRLPSMGSHPCLPRPSVYGSLEPTALSMKLVLDVCSLVEKVSLRVFVTVSHSLTLFVGRDRWFFSCASPFSAPFDLLSERRDLFRCFSAHLLFISLRIPWDRRGHIIDYQPRCHCCETAACCADELLMPTRGRATMLSSVEK